MVSDGIENCLQYIHNFDPDKSNNPFVIFHTNNILYISQKNTKRKETTTYQKPND